ncbi:transcriptional regulator [Azorhizobium caulinodans ORS 571]|uniref:Transcriptional regulator n=2 Tax=Azorhizobium caulinodans TaxID=7 RepID=A8I9E0_AZOC5|nr:transcriptional regulator [Azorhizobium caulinodans ORS 571]
MAALPFLLRLCLRRGMVPPVGRMTCRSAPVTAFPVRAPAATLADVASAAGVGESTVSRVLRNHGSFSEKTRKRVMEAAAQLGYVPNRIAGTLASSGSRLVGIIVPSLSNIVFPEVLSGVNQALEDEGYQAVFAVSEYKMAREEEMVASMLAWRPAALMVAGLEHTPAARALLEAGGTRIIELMDLDGEPIDIAVGFSNLEVGRVSARHLLARGYRRIAYVGHDLAADTRAAKRLEGFEGVLRDQGLALMERSTLPTLSSIEAGRAGLEQALARRPDLEAVYFSNDDMAFGGYCLCLSRGIRVPDQLALFGYNGLGIGQALPQPLSTIRTPRVEIGATAARLAARNAPAQRIDLGFELIAGATA